MTPLFFTRDVISLLLARLVSRAKGWDGRKDRLTVCHCLLNLRKLLDKQVIEKLCMRNAILDLFVGVTILAPLF